MDPITLRRATRADAPAVFALVRALAEHEGQPEHLLASAEGMARDGLAEGGRFEAILAERDGVAVGFASWTVNYSIWYGADYLNVDDVFVSEDCRGSGIGARLMRAIAAECRARGCAFARWTVEEDNAGAIRFYRSLGVHVRGKGICSWLPRDMPAAP